MKEDLASFSSFGFEKLGEFPLVEGSFRNLIHINLPLGISSLDDEILLVLESIICCFWLDFQEANQFAKKNEELKERSNYGKLKKY